MLLDVKNREAYFSFYKELIFHYIFKGLKEKLDWHTFVSLRSLFLQNTFVSLPLVSLLTLSTNRSGEIHRLFFCAIFSYISVLYGENWVISLLKKTPLGDIIHNALIQKSYKKEGVL